MTNRITNVFDIVLLFQFWILAGLKPYSPFSPITITSFWVLSAQALCFLYLVLRGAAAGRKVRPVRHQRMTTRRRLAAWLLYLVLSAADSTTTTKQMQTDDLPYPPLSTLPSTTKKVIVWIERGKQYDIVAFVGLFWCLSWNLWWNKWILSRNYWWKALVFECKWWLSEQHWKSEISMCR